MKNLILLQILLFFFSLNYSMAQPGSLDPDFDADGKVITSIGSDLDAGNSIVVQPDGKIVIAGYSEIGTTTSISLVRYNIDGTLDNSFDNDGKLSIFIGTGDSRAYSIMLQPDGKIVVGGTAMNGTSRVFAIIRLNNDGSFDNTFDTDGKVMVSLGSTDDRVYSLVLQPDGKIIAAGTSENGSDYYVALARLNTDGSLDNTFSVDGKLTTSVASNWDVANSVALQTDGKILVAGSSSTSSSSEYFIIRYNTDGTIDNTFNMNGIVISSINYYDEANSIAIQTDQKIIVAGRSFDYTVSYIFLARYNTNGTIDNSFGSNGIVLTSVEDYASANAMVLQPDGKILVAGETRIESNKDFVLVRYNSDGTLDDTFGNGGKVTTAIGYSNDFANAIALQPDGRIVVAGQAEDNGKFCFAAARYISGLNIGTIDFSSNISTFIYPNPAKESANLEFSLNKEELISIELLDINGKLVQQFLSNQKINIGNHQYYLKFDDSIPSGVYILNIGNGMHSHNLKIIKQ